MCGAALQILSAQFLSVRQSPPYLHAYAAAAEVLVLEDQCLRSGVWVKFGRGLQSSIGLLVMSGCCW